MCKVHPGGQYSVSQPSLQPQQPALQGATPDTGPRCNCMLYDPNELVLCGTKEKGVHGCLVASLKADVLGDESAGPPAMGAQPEGPAPGRRPWDSGGSFPRGETTTAQCTGQYRLEPVPGRKPGIVRALSCLACLFVLHRCTPLITYFGAGGRCWWPGCLFPTPLPPFPP